MRNENQLKSDQSFESIYASLKETHQVFKELVRERKEMQKEYDKERKEMQKEYDKERKEMQKETKEMKKETREMKKELEKMYAESRKESKELNRQLGGISNSNGDVAEAYFYNALKRDKTFVNEKFDHIKRNLSYNNGEKGAEFDIILFNGKSAALIEVKYNAKPENISVRRIISRVEIFKLLYPEYKNHNIYLAVAAMTFRNGLEQRLHRNGIATIRQMGKKMVVYDKEVKVF